MNIRREDQEKKDHDKVKRQFIREQLKPQRRKNMIRVMQKIVLVLCAAVLFGGISALSFYIMRIYFPWEDLDENVEVAALNRVAASPEAEERTVTDEIGQDSLTTLEDYDQVSRALAEVGEQANAAIVGLGHQEESASGVFDQTMSSQEYCGILFHETTHYYYILTEYAAAQSADSVMVTFHSGKVVSGNLTGRSNTLDLAVYCVRKADFTKEEQREIVISELGDASALALGSYVLAVGQPNGNLYSVGTGMITDQIPKVPILDQTLQLYSVSIPYQAERAGFVINIQGQLIGMITTKHIPVTGEIDTGFIALSGLAADINLLLKGENAPYMGIQGTDVSPDQAETLKLVSGIYLDTVESGSPAYQGGMRVADVITALDGQTVQTMEQLHEYMVKCESGQEITATIYRQCNAENVKKQLKVTLQ